MKYISFLGFAVYATFISCVNSDRIPVSRDKVPVISVDLKQIKDTGEVADPRFLLKDVEVIRLSGGSAISLDIINGLLLRGGYIYIFSDRSWSIFNKSGMLIREISTSTYDKTSPDDIIEGRVDPHTGNIVVLTGKGTRLITYDSLGTLKKDVKLSSPIAHFQPVQDKYYFYSAFVCTDEDIASGYAHRLKSVNDENLRYPTHKYLPFHFKGLKKPVSTISQNNFSPLPDQKDAFAFYENFNDTVYTLSSSGLYPRLVIRHRGERETLAGILDNEQLPDKSGEIKKQKLSTLLNWLESERFIVMENSHFAEKFNFYVVNTAFYDKKNNKTHLIENNRLKVRLEGIDLTLGASQYPRFIYEDRFISIVRPADLLHDLYNEQYNHNIHGPVHELIQKFKLDNLTAKDSPILLLYNLETINEK